MGPVASRVRCPAGPPGLPDSGHRRASGHPHHPTPRCRRANLRRVVPPASEIPRPPWAPAFPRTNLPGSTRRMCPGPGADLDSACPRTDSDRPVGLRRPPAEILRPVAIRAAGSRLPSASIRSRAADPYPSRCPALRPASRPVWDPDPVPTGRLEWPCHLDRGTALDQRRASGLRPGPIAGAAPVFDRPPGSDVGPRRVAGTTPDSHSDLARAAGSNRGADPCPARAVRSRPAAIRPEGSPRRTVPAAVLEGSSALRLDSDLPAWLRRGPRRAGPWAGRRASPDVARV